MGFLALEPVFGINFELNLNKLGEKLSTKGGQDGEKPIKMVYSDGFKGCGVSVFSKSIFYSVIALTLVGCSQQRNGNGKPQVPLLDQLGGHETKISTGSKASQKYFNQGVVLTYGFHHQDAIRSFQEAIRQDPNCPLCYWGLAKAVGPHINAPMTPKTSLQGWRVIEEAKRQYGYATEKEWDMIEALGTLFSPDQDQDIKEQLEEYSYAMRQLHQKYPDDADIKTQYAESLMLLTPWDYWSKEGEPKENTLEIVEILETTLEKDPNHPGANHFYIHIMEASNMPERALDSAHRLHQGLVPDVGHLVHMPSHIYANLGQYNKASEANQKAIETEEKLLKQGKITTRPYYPHNWHFLWYSSSQEGRKEQAQEAAEKASEAITAKMIENNPKAEWRQPAYIFSLIQFEDWEEILKEPPPLKDQQFSTAMWRYARGLAYLNLGQFDRAKEEQAALKQLIPDVNNSDWPKEDLIEISYYLLSAEIASSMDQLDKMDQDFTRAMELEDALPYNEPPYWPISVRQRYGFELLCNDEPKKAENLFLEDLEINPQNGRSLFGLMQSLYNQDNLHSAQEVERHFNEAWKRADVTLEKGCPPIQEEKNK